MKAVFLSQDKFEESFTLAPRLAVCLQVKDRAGGILLAKRSQAMKTMPGAWHYPGGFLLLNETFEDCIRRVAEKELGATVHSYRQVGCFEDLDGDPRGHVVDLVFEADLSEAPSPTQETEKLQFFSSIPVNVAFYHDRILRAAGLA